MLLEKFLYSVIEAGSSEELYKVRDEHLAKDQDVLVFVQDFYATYRKFPDVGTVEGKFNITLLDNTETPEYWRREIVDKYREGVIHKTVVNVAKDSTDAIDKFQEAIIKYHSEGDVSVTDYADGKDRVNQYKQRKGTNGITYVSTGSAELDMFSLGYKRTDLWTLGGAEGIGKTWQLLRMADAVDLELLTMGLKRTVLIISGEMSAEELTERLDAIRFSLDYHKLSRGKLGKLGERKYLRALQTVNTNIKIVDSFDSIQDVEYYISIYRPAICFIDGSHLLAPSYDWKDIAWVTASMKRITRNNKIPIVNTTHLKSEKGKGKTNSLDDFAYTKGYTRDSDIVGLMFANDLMEIDGTVGIDWLKVRRGDKYRTVIQTDRSNSVSEIVEHRSLKEVLAESANYDDADFSGRDDSNHKSVMM
jgi:hypothetical protein